MMLDQLSGYPCIRPQGGWSLLIDTAAMSLTAQQATERLLTHALIAATPMIGWGPAAHSTCAWSSLTSPSTDSVTCAHDSTPPSANPTPEGNDPRKRKTMKPADQQPRPNILLVHGAVADGSIWRHVIHNLQHNFTVVASQLPLTSFGDNVKAVKRDLSALQGSTVVVGHSYGGAVVTQAAAGASNVTSLVYIAAIVPDTGESVRSLLAQYPRPPSAQYFVPVDPNETPPFFIFQRDQFPQFFCHDVELSTARAQAAAQGRPQKPVIQHRSRESRPGGSSLPGTRFAVTTDHSTPLSKGQ
jgi:pimeloyl-ACP methyl ester carboxylesterase